MNLIFFASSTFSPICFLSSSSSLSLSIARFSPRRAAGSGVRRPARSVAGDGVRRPLRRGAVREAERSLAGDAERAVAGDATRGTAAGGRRVRRVWRGREDLAPKPRGRTASVDSVGDSKPSHTTHDELSASCRSTSRCRHLARRRHHAVRSEITSLIAKNWI